MTTLKIQGMSCNHCVMAVVKALSAVDGVKTPQVNLEKGEATFEENPAVDMNSVIQAVEKAGYKVG
jgi:copper chaperone